MSVRYMPAGTHVRAQMFEQHVDVGEIALINEPLIINTALPLKGTRDSGRQPVNNSWNEVCVN